MARQPAFMFYPADWLTDANLRTLSHEARGVWIDTLCYMHKSERYGQLIIGGKPLSVEEWANLCKADARCLQDLLSAGVARMSKRRRIIFSARMVRDQRARRRNNRYVVKHRSLTGKRRDARRLQDVCKADARRMQGPSSYSSSGSPKNTDRPTANSHARAGARHAQRAGWSAEEAADAEAFANEVSAALGIPESERFVQQAAWEAIHATIYPLPEYPMVRQAIVEQAQSTARNPRIKNKPAAFQAVVTKELDKLNGKGGLHG